MTSTGRFSPPRDSVFTPFLRRFTDERARDLEDTRRLYAEVHAQSGASVYADEDAHLKLCEEIVGEVVDFVESLPSSPVLCEAVCKCLSSLVARETTIFDFPHVDFDAHALSLKELVDLRRFLRAKQHFLTNDKRVLQLLKEALVNLFGGLIDAFPEIPEKALFSTPLISLLPQPNVVVDKVIRTLYKNEFLEAGLFTDILERLYGNLCAASGMVPSTDHKKPFKTAGESDLPPVELVEKYLGGTPLRDLLLTPVPLNIPFEARFSHMHVVGGSGAGKTTLLQNLILNDLTSDDPPALVVIDSQGDMISKLSRLALFDPDGGPLSDRFMLITPKDISHPPAINVFDVNRSRLGRYDEATREQVVAGVIETFDYLFTGLLGADLTAKQSVFFRFVARLMLAIPEALGRNATVLDMMALMEDTGPYAAAIRSLAPIPRQFFERDFPSKTFAQTKEQIRYRLNAILENPTLARLFTAPSNRVDLFDALNSGAIVLVDTAQDFLKGASSHFGRIFISLVLQAVLERAAIPEHQRRPAFLIVDEAAQYFDSNIDELLTAARKYKLGCLFAHQFLEQCTPSLRASLAANTAIKLAAGVSNSDARNLAPDLRTTPEFVLSQPRLHFAAYVRNVTPKAMSLGVPYGLLEEQPTLSTEAYGKLRERNRDRVSLRRKPEQAPAGAPPPSPQADPSKPAEW